LRQKFDLADAGNKTVPVPSGGKYIKYYYQDFALAKHAHLYKSTKLHEYYF
jgi:hypothetical protein